MKIMLIGNWYLVQPILSFFYRSIEELAERYWVLTRENQDDKHDIAPSRCQIIANNTFVSSNFLIEHMYQQAAPDFASYVLCQNITYNMNLNSSDICAVRYEHTCLP